MLENKPNTRKQSVYALTMQNHFHTLQRRCICGLARCPAHITNNEHLLTFLLKADAVSESCPKTLSNCAAVFTSTLDCFNKRLLAPKSVQQCVCRNRINNEQIRVEGNRRETMKLQALPFPIRSPYQHISLSHHPACVQPHQVSTMEM